MAKVLGLDLGTESLGWALLDDHDMSSIDSDSVGSRLFLAGLEDLQKDGQGSSRNVQRREARLVRRHTERRRRRQVRVAKTLQSMGLLPEGNIASSESRTKILMDLDKTLPAVYHLRTKALDERLEPHELGRALYHLSQRRGFLSNRKSPPKADEDEGVVKCSIGSLQRELDETSARTIGELFSRWLENGKPVRGVYTARSMYESEFKLIWRVQSSFYPDILTEQARKNLHRAIFYQRPLMSVKHLVGECQLERGRRRASWAMLSAQQFRYLQRVNDLRIIDKSTGEIRELRHGERQLLTETLETAGDQTFGAVRKLLGLSGRSHKFNLEEGGEKKLPGNRTASALAEIIGVERWESMKSEEQDKLVEDLLCINNDSTLRKRAETHWGLDGDSATRLTQLRLEKGYCSFSRQALRKLLPELKAGESLQTIIREMYPERWECQDASYELLPPVACDALPELRNPVVERTLSELRRVVNSIIRDRGLPDIIRVELARDLRQSGKQRKETIKRNRENEAQRQKAAERIVKETGITGPSRSDIQKVILADECNWMCPYTGKAINISDLVGPHPLFDIEHIIPFSRCLDNSFVNKTLCDATENRERKRNRTPFEAYSETEEWSAILERVSLFKGRSGIRYEKLRRFKMNRERVQEFCNSFSSRQLNDTRWASKWAKRYLGLLYGGVNGDGIDSAGVRRVQVSTGQATAYLRREWGLNSILGDEERKSRDDHRHHAVDALVIALTTPEMIRRLSVAAQRASSRFALRLFDAIEPPWEGFRDDVQRVIGKVVASHKVTKRVSGPLHKETFYGKPRIERKDGKRHSTGRVYVHQRVRLDALTVKNIEKIVDSAVRERVRQQLQRLGVSDPKKAFSDPDNHPSLGPDGSTIPIHHVRIKNYLKTFPVASGERLRHVQTKSIHHMEMIGILNDAGEVVKWDAEVVNMLEAYRRRKDGESIIKRDHGPGKRFLFSLANRETIMLDTDEGKRELFVVRTIPESKQITFVPINDARPLKEIGRTGFTAYPESLRRRHCQKTLVSPLGVVRRAND